MLIAEILYIVYFASSCLLLKKLAVSKCFSKILVFLWNRKKHLKTQKRTKKFQLITIRRIPDSHRRSKIRISCRSSAHQMETIQRWFCRKICKWPGVSKPLRRWTSGWPWSSGSLRTFHQHYKFKIYKFCDPPGRDLSFLRFICFFCWRMDVRTTCVKLMTTYSALAWWVNKSCEFRWPTEPHVELKGVLVLTLYFYLVWWT